MPITKPYFGIWRPDIDGTYRRGINDFYALDLRYCPNRVHLAQAYSLLERDLLEVFDYVEPADDNLKTYSHRLYELLLRACTELETNATGILKLNGYRSSRTNWNIEDYRKIELACRLSEYQVRLSTWRGGQGTFIPFASWTTTHTLPWYSDYNSVKHDRAQEFAKANLGNVMQAVTGVVAILVAQFFIVSLSRLRPFHVYVSDVGWYHIPGGVFEVKLPSTWASEDHYDFEWSELRTEPQPFQQFRF